MNELVGKVALVTGASRGIGRAVALALADRGADVVVHYRQREDAAAEVVAEIERKGGRAIAIAADLADLDAIPGLFARVDEAIGSAGGRLDILVNNAASIGAAPLVDMDIAQAARRFPEGGGRIITISSLNGRIIGRPDDIADVVAFLASDAARWVTGQILGADGGVKAW